jgi:hypothetical protein
MAAAVVAASASHARVEDSTSVSRNVTVPEGLRTTAEAWPIRPEATSPKRRMRAQMKSG